jgi:hypothetical protein
MVGARKAIIVADARRIPPRQFLAEGNACCTQILIPNLDLGVHAFWRYSKDPELGAR